MGLKDLLRSGRVGPGQAGSGWAGSGRADPGWVGFLQFPVHSLFFVERIITLDPFVARTRNSEGR